MTQSAQQPGTTRLERSGAQTAIWGMTSDDPGQAKVHEHGQKAHRHNPRQEVQRSESISGGVRATSASKETRLRMSGRNSLLTSRTYTGSSGSASRTHAAELDRNASPSKITGQPQTRLLGEDVGRGKRLDEGEAQQDEKPKYRSCKKQKPAPTMARANKRLASRLYRLKMEQLPYRPVPAVDDKSPRRQVLVVPVQVPDSRAPVQKLPAGEKPAEDPLSHHPGGFPGLARSRGLRHDRGAVH